MTIVLFLAILAALVFVHELGHFIAAKRAGIRVDEFGLGFPPRLFSVKRGETRYSLNLIPFGGFVKILGEDAAEVRGLFPQERKRSLPAKPRGVQAAVLAAGVAGNVVLAWLLVSIGFMAGFPVATADLPAGAAAADPRLMVVGALADSPAALAGLRAGDVIVSLRAGGETLLDPTPASAQAFIAPRGGREIEISYRRGDATRHITVVPREGVAPEGSAIGVVMEEVATLSLPPHRAIVEGAKVTARLSAAVALGIGNFIRDAFAGRADLSQIAGPVGIAGLVAEASELGFSYLISFTAFISINLAVLNLLPFPALDGGRILFLLLEALWGRAFNPRAMQAVNSVGFALLVLLMLLVTYRDVAKLF